MARTDTSTGSSVSPPLNLPRKVLLRGVCEDQTAVARPKKKWSVEMLITDEERKHQTAKWGILSSLACLIPHIKTIFTESRQCEKPAFHDKLRWVHATE